MRLALSLAVVLLAPASRALADTNDLVMSRLALPMPDANGTGTSYIPQNQEMRSLASQLGVVLAPHMLTTADTVGFGGFQFTVDLSDTSIDSDAAYWRVREGAKPGGSNGSGTMQTVGMFARKGLWFPIPSFEVGLGAVHLVDSNIWTGQLYTKVALVEGYHQLPLPSLAVRGGVSRMMVQRELDLTVASLDVLVSKHFGIGGTWRLEPFAGWNVLMIIPRSEVIEPTPTIDPLTDPTGEDGRKNFVFKDQDNIYRQRVMIGAKFRYHIVQLTLEAVFAFKGSSVDDRAGTMAVCGAMSMTTNCDSTDTAAAQRTLSLSAGFDF